MYDIAIVGAGPAGSTLARMLGTRYRVFVADRRRLDLDSARDSVKKTCGGLLAPSAQRELVRQGLGVPASILGGPALFAVKALDLAADLERLYQRFYINVDREGFDRWLVSLVPDGIEAGFGWRLTHLDRDREGSFLRFVTAEGGQAGIRARLVVGADGASSLVRRLAFPDVPAPQRYSAVQAEYETASPDVWYGAIFDASATDFYGWTIPKGDSLLVGAAFQAGQGVPARFDALVDRLRARGMRLGSQATLSSSRISRPTGLGQLCPGSGGVVLVGEAGGFVSPSSAEGISYALGSAATLARALDAGLDGAEARYREAMWPIALNIGVKMLKSSAIYGTTTRRFIMRSGVGAIEARDRAPVASVTQFAR